MMTIAIVSLLTIFAVLFPLTGNAAVTATAPYSISVFAQAASGQTAPDSIAFDSTNIFVGFGNGGAPDGSGGAVSTIVEYDLKGTVVKTFSVNGHNDGLRVDSKGNLWAIENEDANASIVLINPKTGNSKTYTFPSPAPHGGGYDDAVFDGNEVFISASNPANNPNNKPAVVSVKLKGKTVAVSEVLSGAATAINVVTGNPVTLNLQDPDSMILDPNGDLLLDSQGDEELIVIENPGLSCQQVMQVPLTTTIPTSDTPMADDTVFARSGQGRIVFADKPSGTIYSITAPYFAPGAAFTAYQNSAGTAGFIGQTDLSTGVITPIVSGLGNPGGEAFISSDPNLNAPKVVTAGITAKCP
jgi:hypothetical protein